MGRAPNIVPTGMTQISISLPKSLVAEIDKMAEADNRNRSNFIANTLANMARNYAETQAKGGRRG